MADPTGLLVPASVSRAKLARELGQWRENGAAYRRRGWLLLDEGELHVELAMLASVALSGGMTFTATAAVRIDFSNYDLWAPSVEFIDPTTGAYLRPPVRAIVGTADGPRDLLVENHPTTGRPFLCVPGVRQYHDHPQHSGDAWLLHRGKGAGTLASICDVLWRSMARNVIGLRTTIQSLPVAAAVRAMLPPGAPPPLQAQVEAVLAQGDVDSLEAQLGLGLQLPGSA